VKRCTIKVRRKRARRPKELICKAVNSVQYNVVRENFEKAEGGDAPGFFCMR
jgi:hypothetical protein